MTPQQQSSAPAEPIRSMRDYEQRFFPKRAEQNAQQAQPVEERGRELAQSLLDDLKSRLRGENGQF